MTNFTYLFGDKTAIDGFEVVLEPVVPNLDAAFLNRLENSKKFFHLPELYNGHKDYVLSLFFKNYVFSDDYIELLCQQFPDLFPTKEEVKGLLYLMDIDKENWGKRSLCKLTHDIDLEIS